MQKENESEDHNSQIDAFRPEPQKNSPATEDAAETYHPQFSSPASRRRNRAPQKSITLLLVGGDADVELLVRQNLDSRPGSTLQVCTHPSEALDRIRTNAPCAILLSPKAGDVFALELISRVRITMHNLPVIVLTAMAD